MAKKKYDRAIWSSVAKALDAELRDATVIEGSSGLEHRAQAIAVDENTRRVIIFSAESSPRLAALMQVDVQATMPSFKVIVARPILFDLSEIARRTFAAFGTADANDLGSQFENWSKASVQDQTMIINAMEPMFGPLFKVAHRLELPPSPQFIGLAQQITSLNWEDYIGDTFNMGQILGALMSTLDHDSSAADRDAGICPIPLYEFEENDWEMLQSGRRVAAIRNRLKELGIYQYFFPPTDHLMLGLADEGVRSDTDIVIAAEKSKELGHLSGQPEIFKDVKNTVEFLEALKSAGYIAEGEFGVTTTPKGQTLRQNVKIRPREGLIKKLSKIIRLNIRFNSRDFTG